MDAVGAGRRLPRGRIVGRGMTRINGWACVLLVVLRLAIGWHFFIEGLAKIESHRHGKTATNAPWTREGFFREGSGPAAGFPRDTLGMSDKSTLARFTVQSNQFPPALAAEWESEFDRFATHYGLSAGQKQKAT